MTTIQYLIGTDPVGFFFAKLVLAYAGAFLLVLWGAKKAQKHSERSPDRFSWAYLWTDNTKRFIANLIVIYVGVRFMAQLMPPAATEEAELVIALIVGISVDALTARLKKWKSGSKEDKAE